MKKRAVNRKKLTCFALVKFLGTPRRSSFEERSLNSTEVAALTHPKSRSQNLLHGGHITKKCSIVSKASQIVQFASSLIQYLCNKLLHVMSLWFTQNWNDCNFVSREVV